MAHGVVTLVMSSIASIHLYLFKNLHMTHHRAIRIELDEKFI